jgi:GTP cyclohydrolase-4
VLELVPGATHNQRGVATLRVTASNDDLPEPAVLAGLARASMSATTHELLKRDDERAVVEAAHAKPMFVEDCVRELVASLLSCGIALPDDAEVCARQVNHESIHAHDATAELSGTVASLRASLNHG